MGDRATAREGEWSPPAGRLRWSRADGLAMAEAFRKSGLTAPAFADRHGIGVWRVQRWARGQRAPRTAVALVKPAAVRFAPVRIVPPASADIVEVVVGRAVVRVARDFDADLLRRVILALGDATC